MKRIVLVLAIALMVVSGSYAKSLDEFDGYNWAELSSAAKTYVIAGYLIAMNSSLEFYHYGYTALTKQERTPKNITKLEALEFFMKWATTSADKKVGDILNMVDLYYSNPDNMTSPLIYVIPFVCEQSWWDADD